MSSEAQTTHWAIRAQGVGKTYRLYDKPHHRLLQSLWRGRKSYYREFAALHNISFELERGQTLGIIGRNGAGKSTLLQIICGTLHPSAGNVQVRGRIAALLELGTGFNPEFTGRENIAINAAILGLSQREISERLDDIIAFADIGTFIDQPVKTYSSGMFVRLAFSLATSVDPDILIVDEALSVGDGEFSRKSFDRIYAMKERGTTILFCSHSLYQVEAFCSRVMWLNKGRLQAIGEPHDVVRQYDMFLAGESFAVKPMHNAVPAAVSVTEPAAMPANMVAPDATAPDTTATPGYARITRALTGVDGHWGPTLQVRPGESTLQIVIEFDSDPALPMPTAGVTIDLPNVTALTCSIARTDGVLLQRDAQGRGTARIDFPRIPLRKGRYHVGVYLGAENAVHIYDNALAIATLHVDDILPEPGLVTLPHHWHAQPGHQSPSP